MNITELRSTLHEYADELTDVGMPDRARASRRRASVIRRQRLAIAGGTLAVVLALATSAFLTFDPLGGAKVQPAEEPDQDILRTSFAGRSLIDSNVATGAGTLTLTATTDGPSQWVATCFGVGSAYTLHQSIDGRELQEPCLDEAPSDPPWGPRLDQAGSDIERNLTMRIWITRTTGGQDAAPAEAVLAAAAYRLPEYAAVVAGARVYDLEESEGVVWRQVHSSQSEPGAQTYATTFDSGDQPVFIEVLTAGSADTPVDVYVDGVLQANGPQQLGADSCWLGSFPAGSHRVRMTVRDQAPADAVLGVVWRTPDE